MSEPRRFAIVDQDPWLGPYAHDVARRYERYRAKRAEIERAEGALERFALGHQRLGLHRGERDGRAGVWYREWAPGAQALFLCGDFNDWDRVAHPMVSDEFGVWSLFVPDGRGGERLVHGSRVKVHVHARNGTLDRIPAYIRRVVFDERTHDPCGVYWHPPAFSWRHTAPRPDGSPLHIYEAHPGMALEEGRVGTWREFTEQMLPRIVRAGYNAVQLMAVQEHPYYASFGYHVSNLFAPSSRFGEPEDLKRLVDAAHGAGLRVILDVVHSHMVRNVHDGLNRFDGTDHQYFHAGPRGEHIAWDSLLWDYDKWEVLRLLLSNVRYWLEEYRFDGMRFDGVGSMMYLHHGLGRTSWDYDDYFRRDLDEPAITYLQLACEAARAVNPHALLIAEDVSGMVGLARPVEEGGIGFTHRLAMGIPDYWVRLLRTRRDEEWNLGEMFHTLTNRRRNEAHVAYAESHDQAMVGDKTLAFWLMDAEMYTAMQVTSQSTVIDRGVALHKMIRLVTFALGGEAWLNFMGNEFGHPEWIDFPREGNGFSYHYARRQWSLADREDLRYAGLGAFDRAMMMLDADCRILAASSAELRYAHEERKLLAFERGGLLFVFNFHPTTSYADYVLPLRATKGASLRLLLDTDALQFGGHGRLAAGQEIPFFARGESERLEREGGAGSAADRRRTAGDGGHAGGRAVVEGEIRLYVPTRTAIVLQMR